MSRNKNPLTVKEFIEYLQQQPPEKELYHSGNLAFVPLQLRDIRDLSWGLVIG
jgi:hypothetical protein